jgi:hypothetical protein
MPSIHVTCYVQEQYTTVAKATIDNQLVELPNSFSIEKADSGEIAKLRDLVKDRIASIEVEVLRQLEFALTRARHRERDEAEARRQEAEAERAGSDVPWPTPVE